MHLKNEEKSSDRILNLYEDFLRILDKEDNISVNEHLRPTIQQINSGEFHIVVMGEIKKGKSSLISALLGEYEILPVYSDVATSTVFKILYGDEYKYSVHLNTEKIVDDNNSQNKFQEHLIEINRDQIVEYGTEKGNPKNTKNVDYIQIEIPNQLLSNGIVIVDTPGIGGLFKNHREITLKYAPLADAIFFVIDSVESLISEQEINFLKDLYKITENIYFFQTKKDAVDSDSWKAWMKRNLDILTTTDKLKDFLIQKNEIKYFPVSSKLKKYADESKSQKESAEDLEDSGFPPVLDFIENNLILNKKELQTSSLGEVLKREVNRKIEYYEDLLNIMKDNNDKIISEKEYEMKGIIEDLKKFKNNKLSDSSEKFNYELDRSTTSALGEINVKFSPDSEKFQQRIESLKDNYDSIKKLKDNIDEIVSDHIVQCSEIGKNIVVKFIDEVQKSFYELTQKVIGELEIILNKDKTINKLEPNLDCSIDVSSVVLSIGAGGVAGAAIAGGMWWGLVGAGHAALIAGPGGALLFGGAAAAGPIGWAAIGAVALLGACGTGLWFERFRNKAKVRDAINEIKNVLVKISHHATENTRTTVLEIQQRFKLESNEILNAIESEARSDIEAKLKEIQNLKKMTEKELKNQEMHRESQIKNLGFIAKDLQDLI